MHAHHFHDIVNMWYQIFDCKIKLIDNLLCKLMRNEIMSKVER
jgi:hypothetical protein